MVHTLDDALICKMIVSAYQMAARVYAPSGELILFASPFERLDAEEQIFTETRSKERLLELCRAAQAPQVFSSEMNQLWAGVPVIDDGGNLLKTFVIGPIYTSDVSESLMIEYARDNQLIRQSTKTLLEIFRRTPVYSYLEFSRLIAMLYYLLYQQTLNISGLMMGNLPREIAEFASEAGRHQESRPYQAFDGHATYTFEQYIWECIREGQVEKLRRHLHAGAFGKTGEISNRDPLRQQKNLFISSITMAARAAIEGGLNIEIAYSLSDLYIQQAEAMKDLLPIMTLNENMLYDYAERTRAAKHQTHYSAAVKDCCDYIDHHLREPLLIKEIAEQLGFSPDHLSRKFRHETGEPLNDYIRHAKIAEAKSMLRHSGMPLSEISELLSFSSQSYFSAVFKQLVGVTPKQYREGAAGNRT
ncbi:MAG: helix-turn-helix domain-containing protein [Anaerolineaceae bacterium]|nr:helix-turn-helix domain-containing protein [Anaerolineaceae bacterium]